jgi:hypothetical protein
MVRVDDGVADLEVDALRLGEEVLLQDLGVKCCVGNDVVLLVGGGPCPGPPGLLYVCR